MRILVFSDSHGNLTEMMMVAKKERFDMLMHAGDYGEDLDRLVETMGLKAPFYRVRGNCDYNSLAERELMAEVSGVKIYMAHGNRHAVKSGLNRLYYDALEKGADIAVFGHTHRPLVRNSGELYLLNPGTIAMPHGYGKSYGIIELDEHERRKINIKTVLISKR